MLLAFVHDPLRRSIGGSHPDGGKASLEPALGPGSPTHSLPFGIGQHVCGRPRQDIRNVPLAGATSTGHRPDQIDADRVHLEMTWNAHRPGKSEAREPLSK